MSFIIISIISLFLDGILSNFLPYLVNDLTYFTPIFTVISVFLTYPLFFKNNKKYYLYAFVYGIIYDIFYTNLVFMDSILFLSIAFFTTFIYKNFDISKLRFFLFLLSVIIIYESFFALLILIFDLVPISLARLTYKITHSIIINIIYGSFIHLIVLKIEKKQKKYKIYKLG